MAQRLLLTVLGALLVSLGAGCGGSTEARPDLAFVSTRDGDYAVYEMDADGAGQRRLTEAESEAPSESGRVFFQIEPDWSPDAARIAFSSQRSGSFDIYVMAADGTGTRRLTSTKDDDTSPTWSPDGNRIAFTRGSDVYVMNADGSAARLVSDANAEEVEPAWSPDGRWIAYARREPGTPVREIWVMRPDGSRRRQLTALDTASYSPAWSPDSTRIAFATDNRISQFDIYWVTVENGKTTRVTATPEDSFEPAWSPDGVSIAFSEGGAIYRATVDANGGTAVEEITDRADNDSSPVWNPVLPEQEDEEG